MLLLSLLLLILFWLLLPLLPLQHLYCHRSIAVVAAVAAVVAVAADTVLPAAIAITEPALLPATTDQPSSVAAVVATALLPAYDLYCSCCCCC